MITPRPYQLEGRDFLAARRHALLADGMRVGKTGQAILAAHKAGAQSILVATPAIAVEQWEESIEQWWPSGPLPRVKVVSWDMARRRWASGWRGTVDVFIPDEAHFAANPQASRTHMVYGSDGLGAKAGALWPLSGTPAPRHAGQLYPMLAHFGAVACTYEEFLTAYCYPKAGGWVEGVGGTRTDKIPELRALLQPLMLRRTVWDVCPDMPEVEYLQLPVAGTAPPHVACWVPPGDVASWIEASAAGMHELRIETALAKVPAVVDRIRDLCDTGSMVVVGFHQRPLEELVFRLNNAGIDADVLNGNTSKKHRRRIQEEFHAGKLRVVAANITTAGTAIDLSCARRGIALELDWVHANNAQFAMRLMSLDRMDQVVWEIATLPGSFDERIQAVLMRRARELNQLMMGAK